MIGDIHLYLVGVLLLIGAAFTLLATLGVLRLPDLYTRMHAASKAGVLGAGFALIAIAVYSLDTPVVLRALAGVVFLLLTTPISAHLLARAAYIAGYKPSPLTHINDLDRPGKSKAG